MDAISRISSNYMDWAGRLAPIHYDFLLHAIVLFGVPCALCAWALGQGNRSVFLQILCVAGGIFLSAVVPFHQLTVGNRMVRGGLLLLGVPLLLCLPGILVWLMVPTVGQQRKGRIIAYSILAVLFLANLVLAWRKQ
jgi:hypothetical protein